MSKYDRSPWSWIPTLYFAEGLPYVIVMTVSVIMYKRMGISNTDIALYTSWLYLPWIIKPLWSPVVDLLKTKRQWIIAMQLIIGAGLGCVALTLPLPGFFKLSLGFLWLLAFGSATHDIAIDGFYMLGLSQHQQAWFVGIRTTFYRMAMLTGQGLLIIFAGYLESSTGLNEINVSVNTIEEDSPANWMHPDSVIFNEISEQQSILVYPETLAVSMIPVDKAQADSLAEFVQKWNLEHGFVVEDNDDKASSVDFKTAEQQTENWLESWLKSSFGKEVSTQRQGEITGNIGLVYFKLSHKPSADQETHLNFGMSSGDKSIALRNEPWAGSRITFNQGNWNKSAIAIIQLDQKLKTATNVSFTGRSGNIPWAWAITFTVLGALFILFFFYHLYMLPKPGSDKATPIMDFTKFAQEFVLTFSTFFKKENIIAGILFLLLYRLAESQLVKLAAPFLLDTRELGGLALTTGQVGFIYGTVGLLSLIVGGILGGFLAAKHGLKFWLWPMAIAINLPNAVYIYLSQSLPDSYFIINLCVAVEQFGYGFGFTAFMLYMIYISQGEHKTAHFAITTAFMALGMMIPGMFSGWLQEIIGYTNFFVWVLISTIPSFLILFYLKIDRSFGIKE